MSKPPVKQQHEDDNDKGLVFDYESIDSKDVSSSSAAAAAAELEDELVRALDEANAPPPPPPSPVARVTRPRHSKLPAVNTEVTVARRQYYNRVSRDLYSGAASLPKLVGKPPVKKLSGKSPLKKMGRGRKRLTRSWPVQQSRMREQEEREDRTANRGAYSRRGGGGIDASDRK